MDYFFTSDTHFWHARVIEYCNRPWSSVEEMNEALIERWNERVKPGDTVYHLGDFGFGGTQKKRSILERLNGHKHLIRGNHDHGGLKYGEGLWKSVHRLHGITLYDQHIVMCHFPMAVWDRAHHGTWHLHGHSHGTFKGPAQAFVRKISSDGVSFGKHTDDVLRALARSFDGVKRLDVGVDCHDWYPLSFGEVAAIMAERGQVAVDHHNERTNP